MDSKINLCLFLFYLFLFAHEGTCENVMVNATYGVDVDVSQDGHIDMIGKAPAMSHFITCAAEINKMPNDRNTACSQLTKSMKCAAALMLPLKESCTLDESEYCSSNEIGPGSAQSMHAPMYGAERDFTICHRVYRELKKCDDTQCQAGGNEFKPRYVAPGMEYGSSNTGKAESVKAEEQCIHPVAQIQELSEDACRQLATAKGCFTERLYDASGTEWNQMAADLLLIGLNTQLEQCKKISSNSNDGDEICGPNPVERLTPKNIPATWLYNEDNCKLAHQIGVKLTRYLKECQGTRSDKRTVGEANTQLNSVRVGCYEKGYTATGSVKGYTAAGSNAGCGAEEVKVRLSQIILVASTFTAALLMSQQTI